MKTKTSHLGVKPCTFLLKRNLSCSPPGDHGCESKHNLEENLVPYVMFIDMNRND